MSGLKSFIDNYSRRDYIIKYNINDINKIPQLVSIEVSGLVLVDDLSDSGIARIVKMIELIEGITRQKVVIFGDLNKQKFSQTEKKEIYVKTILRGYNLKEFIKYFVYLIIPMYLYKYNKLSFVNCGEKSILFNIQNGNVLFGLSKDFLGVITIKFNFNLNKNLEQFLSLMNININKK